MKFPFAVPDGLLCEIGYTDTDRYVGFYWESAGDELTVYDQHHTWVGVHDWRPYLDFTQRFDVYEWLLANEIDLGSSEDVARHHLVVDQKTGEGWVLPRKEARAVVKRQEAA